MEYTNLLRFRCLSCNGKGEVLNEYFEYCGTFPKEDFIQIFGIFPGECKKCEHKYWCDMGEVLGCEECNGKGYMDLDLERWKYMHNQEEPH